MVIGGGTATGLPARDVAGFFFAAATAPVRRTAGAGTGAGTGESAGGSSGTGTRAGVFGGLARGKADRPGKTGFSILASAMPMA